MAVGLNKALSKKALAAVTMNSLSPAGSRRSGKSRSADEALGESPTGIAAVSLGDMSGISLATLSAEYLQRAQRALLNHEQASDTRNHSSDAAANNPQHGAGSGRFDAPG